VYTDVCRCAFSGRGFSPGHREWVRGRSIRCTASKSESGCSFAQQLHTFRHGPRRALARPMHVGRTSSWSRLHTRLLLLVASRRNESPENADGREHVRAALVAPSEATASEWFGSWTGNYASPPSKLPRGEPRQPAASRHRTLRGLLLSTCMRHHQRDRSLDTARVHRRRK